MTRKNFISKSKSIYLLPNALTTAALFFGFLSIIAASKGQFEKSVLSIIFAAILDAFDGRVARLTKSESVFGEVYDSLSDMVSFGVAPAMLAYFWHLHSFGKVGSAAVFIYLAGAALRLARFTAKADDGNSLFFSGLPSPAAALCVASYVWVMVEYSVSVQWVHALLLPLTVAMGLLMVSSVRYYSFKKLPFKQHFNFFTMAFALLFVSALLLVEPVLSMLVVFWSYALCIPLYACGSLFSKKKNRNESKKSMPTKVELQARDDPHGRGKTAEKK